MAKRQSLTLATVLFRDTITARMIRTLFLSREMLQGDFMSEYMRRCDRKPTQWSPVSRRTKKPTVNSSGFLNNFGRFVYRSSRGDAWNNAPLRVIVQGSHSVHSHRNTLTWGGPDMMTFVGALRDHELQWAYERLETQMIAPRATDSESDTGVWLTLLKSEIDWRASKPPVPLSDRAPVRRRKKREGQVQTVAA